MYIVHTVHVCMYCESQTECEFSTVNWNEPEEHGELSSEYGCDGVIDSVQM